ncbi:hypothetical protein ABPG75_000488 [Micractinium tetrahymenae]
MPEKGAAEWRSKLACSVHAWTAADRDNSCAHHQGIPEYIPDVYFIIGSEEMLSLGDPTSSPGSPSARAPPGHATQRARQPLLWRFSLRSSSRKVQPARELVSSCPNMDEFTIPGDPEALWAPDCELAFRCEAFVDLSDAPLEEVGDAAENLAFVLCDQDPLCIVEQANFDQLCSLVAAWARVEGPKRRQLLDSLCSSLTCLNAWIDKLLAVPPDAQNPESVRQHRSAYKAYLFFLAWISGVASREAAAAAAPGGAGGDAASQLSQAVGGGRGRKKKAAASGGVAGWDWGAMFPKVVKAVAQAFNTDLWALFRPSGPEEAMLIKAIQLATSALEDPASLKCEEQAANAAHILAMAALKYQQLDNVTAALVDLLTKYEHTPVLVAGTLRYTIQQWDDGRLAAAVLGEIAAVDPAEYERQQNASGEKAGVRSVAAFVKEMASQLPRLMANQIALLLPHLGGKAYSLRSAIVHATGSLLHKAFDSNAVTDAADAQGAQARLRSKQHLLDLLSERIRDQSSYTRVAVLQTWEYLAEHRAIPLGHWRSVTAIAKGRLEDKSSLVRKEALRLLQALMLHNPFGPKLPSDRFEASLATHKAMLEQLLPPEAAEDAMQEGIQVEGQQGGPAAGGAAEGVAVKAEPGVEPSAEEMEMDGEAEGEGGEEGQQEQEAAAAAEEGAEVAPIQPVRSPAEVGWDGTLEELQALVASLELAVAFSRDLTHCMPTITQLLASSTVSDVQESIAMLLACKQFEVDGAPDTIRRMLPLIFAKDQAIKDRIVEALDQLYINGWAGNVFSSAQAARNLIDLATGATLGELGSLEEVVKEFIHKQFLRPVMLHELWEVARSAHTAVEKKAAGAERAHRDLRSALAILSMAAATRPEAFSQEHVDDLLRYGFGAACTDALITRHACITLQRLATNFRTGAYDAILPQIYAALAQVVVASPLPDSAWYSAAESALTAIYTLHPAPEHLSAAILRQLARRAFAPAPEQAAGEAAEQAEGAEAMHADGAGAAATGQQEEGEEEGEQREAGATASQQGAAADGQEQQEGAQPAESQQTGSAGGSQAPVSMHSVVALTRFFFALGHVALQHLVFVERAAKAVRRMRLEREKRAAEERAERMAAGRTPGGAKEDINAELGVGSVAADAELDAMKEEAEGQILAARSLLGPYARVVASVCHNLWGAKGDARVYPAALLALTKLMIVDAAFCDMKVYNRYAGKRISNLDLLFSLLTQKTGSAQLRCNIIIALGDLALRFPNLLEPYTEYMYRALDDSDLSVRKNAVMVLTHLILNDMMKVKGHIAKMAMRLEDEDSRIAALAQLFFHELAKKEYKGTSPVYNLLPDILSNLSKERGLGKAQFQSIMQHLLGYIKKDKQGDSLIEKLCQRFAATEEPAQWHSIAFCLTQLPLSEKGLKKLSESFRFYKHTLHDEEVAAAITSIIQKAKKGSNKQELKAEIEAFEQKIADYAQERADEERTADEARRHAEERRAAVEGASQQTTAQQPGGEVSDMRRRLGGMQLESGGEEVSLHAGDAGDGDGDAMSDGEGGAAAQAAEQEEAAAGGPQPAASEQHSTAVKAPRGRPDTEAAAGAEEQEAEQASRRGGRRSAAAAAAKPTRRAGRRRMEAVEEEEEEESEGEGEVQQEEAEAEEEPPQEQEPAAANRGSRRGRGGKVAALAAKFGGASEEQAGPPAKGSRRSTRRSAHMEEEGGIPAVRVKEEPMA